MNNNITDKQKITIISFVTWIGTVINLLLSILKILFGYLANSKSLISDGVHSISDLATDAMILIGVKYWNAPPDKKHPYGHGKIETLITFIIGLLLIGVAIMLGYEAISVLYNVLINNASPPLIQVNIATWIAMIIAIISIISKELLYRWTIKKSKQVKSSALLANAWHHRSDALSSAPPAIALAGIILGNHISYNLWFLDPIGTLLVCYMLLRAAVEISKSSVSTLIDTSANRVVKILIYKSVKSIDGVISNHKIRTTYIGANSIKVDLHIMVDAEISITQGHDIATAVKYKLLSLDTKKEEVTILDVLVHIEPATRKQVSSYNNNKRKPNEL